MVRKIDKVIERLGELTEAIDGDNARKARLYDKAKEELGNVCIGVSKAAMVLNGECGVDVIVNFAVKPSKISISDLGEPRMEPFLKSLISLGILPQSEIQKIGDAIEKAIQESKNLG